MLFRSVSQSRYLGMTKEHLKAIEDDKYILLIDEEVDVIEGYNKYNKDDLEYLIEMLLQKIYNYCLVIV